MLALTLCLAKAQPSEPQGTITGRAWLGIGGTSLASITGNERFPDDYDVEVYLPYFEWNPSPDGDIFVPANNAYGNNYAAQIMGYFHPPVSGDYIFWISADDNADLWLSTDSDPANKYVIAREAGWSNARNWDSVGGGSNVDDKRSDSFGATEWPSGNTITLQAGEAYYIEALMKEGGGGDNLAVAVEDPNGIIDPTLPIPGEYLSSIQPSGPLMIVTQPAGATVNPLDAVTLSVEVSGTPPYTFQWSKDGTDIEGANSASYSIDRVDNTHAGSYRVAVSGAEGSADSDPAVITVNTDSEPPTIIGATGSETFASARVTFSEPVDATTGGNPSNYSLSGGVNVTGATVGAAPNDHIVTLTTSAQEVGVMLTVTVNNVTDLFGNAIAADSSMEFSTFIWQEGVVLHKFWQGTPNNIQGLIDDPRFPDSPDFVTLEPFWEYGPGGVNESGSNYGNQLVGWFIPPADGEYIFFTNSDDPSDLFLSTDDDPANKLLIAREAGWSNARNWVGVGGGASNIDDKRSDFFIDSEWPTLDITLEAGERYYLESLHTEGGGGDSVAATVIRSTDPDPENGDAPTLTGSLIGTYLDPNGISVNILTQPADASVFENLAATFTVEAEGSSAYGTGLGYQWQMAPAGSDNFTDIDGATGASYTTDLLPGSANGNQYRVIIGAPTITLGTTISDVATLTVDSDSTAPSIVSAGALSGSSAVGVLFDERLDPASAADAGNYSVSGVNVTGAEVFGAENNIVKLSLSGAPAAGYTVTVDGVTDLAGNAANGSLEGESVPMTHEDINDPALEGDAFGIGNGGFYVAGGGNDIWGNADMFHFVHAPHSGSFDIRVRVVSLEGTHSWAKSGIMVREELDPAARHVDILTTRTEGQNITNVQWRDTFGGGSASKPGGERVGPVPYPNAWIRLTREDGNSNEFKGYLSTDGVSWGDPYHVYNMTEDTDGPFASDVIAGLAVTSHDNNPDVPLAQAIFTDYSITEYMGEPEPPADANLAISTADGSITITWDAGTLSSSSEVNGTYTPVNGATSPYTVDASAAGAMFYKTQ